MLRQLNKIAIVLALGFGCLVLNNGCYDTRVTLGEEPTYRQPPPPPEETKPPRGRGHGPPPWAPAHGYRAKHHYRYYPSSEVYFDIGRAVYIYYEGERWRVSVKLPGEIRIDLNDYVTLEMDTDKPYEYHSEVVKRYPPGHKKKKSKAKEKSKWK
jgi:hypothetical protein